MRVPFAPDNLEMDVTGGILVVGHPSTYIFMAHAGLSFVNSPSAGVLLYPNMTYESVYLDRTGNELSGGSVATRFTTTDGRGNTQLHMYIGQVFEPYLLHCVL